MFGRIKIVDIDMNDKLQTSVEKFGDPSKEVLLPSERDPISPAKIMHKWAKIAWFRSYFDSSRHHDNPVYQPGEFLKNIIPEEDRKILRKLKSDDIKKQSVYYYRS